MSDRKTSWISGILLVLGIVVGFVLAAWGHPGPVRLLLGLLIVYLTPWLLVFQRVYPATRPVTVRFLACSLAIGMGIFCFELPALVGLIDYRRPFTSPTLPWERPGNRADPDLLYIKSGHARVQESFTGNETPWISGLESPTVYTSNRRYDADGFRNGHDLEIADVVLLGDSFIEGAHVSESELISSRLEQELGGQAKVLNLGQAGYGPGQELVVLKRFGLPRRPSICVWAFYEGNDLDDIDEYVRQKIVFETRRATSWTWTSRLVERSFTANMLDHALRAWIDPPLRRPASNYRGWLTNEHGERVPLYFASGDYRQEPTRAETLDRLRTILAEAQADCARQNVRLVVAFIPTKLRTYRSACRFEEKSIVERWPLDDLPKALGDLVAGLPSEVTYLDLTPPFQAEAVRGALLYLPDDTHWTAQGHRTAAHAIAQFIRPLRSAQATR